MTGAGHRVTALFSAALAYPLCKDYGFAAAVACALSGTAPDWLEVPWRTWTGRQRRLIPHRRITHWAAAWLVLAAFGWSHSGTMLWATVFGFACGGLTHLLMDLPNPAGIPVLHPWHRRSLNWWRSGEHEILVSVAWAAVCIIGYTVLTTGYLEGVVGKFH
jgi:membrane-bound metal-dependent hydrolase YbcI (DUF457 family)